MANLLIIVFIFIEISTLQNYAINDNSKVKGNFHTTLQKNKMNDQKKKERIKKPVIKSKRFKWSFPIKYHVEKKLGKTVVETAIKLIQKETCITFNKSEHYLKNESGINFIPHKRRCASYIGKQSNRAPQSIYLNDFCKKHVGNVLHEISHALGKYHEVSRNDRSKYVNIIFKNAQPKLKHNFNIISSSELQTFGISYDLGSVMHYGFIAFSIGGRPTVVPLDGNYNKTIGQRVGFTFNDVKFLNYLYCNDTCSNSTIALNCHNDGYPDPKNCSQCKCPLGFAGVNCTTLKPQSQSQDEKCKPYYFNATSTESTLSKIGIMNCTFHIKSEGPKVVNVVVTNMTATPAPNPKGFYCFSEMALEIKHKKDTSATGLCLCGNISEPINITSEGDEVFVMWYGKKSHHTFTLKYKEVDRPSDKTT